MDEILTYGVLGADGTVVNAVLVYATDNPDELFPGTSTARLAPGQGIGWQRQNGQMKPPKPDTPTPPGPPGPPAARGNDNGGGPP